MNHSASVLVVFVLVLAAGCGDGTNPTSSAPAPAEGGSSQDAVKAEIERLEQMEVQAVLTRDVPTIKKLWDAQFVVNSPANQIVLATPDPADRPVLQQPRTSFTREVEHIMVRGDTVISMGSETVVPAGDLPQSGETVKRRYTNVWMKVDDAWKLVARHANEVREPR